MTDNVVDIKRLKRRAAEFGRINKKAGGHLLFSTEAEFASAAVNQGGKYLQGAYNNDPERLEMAVLGAASLGLSLNPSLNYACVVPRAQKKGEPPVLRFELMYQGLIKLATAEGAVKGLRVGVVHRNDPFEYDQATGHLSHKPDPFARKESRGPRVGAYCVAILHDGTELPHVMGHEEIEDIKSRIPNMGYSPWKGKYTEDQMWIKTCIKQASKFWPRTTGEHINFREAVAYDDQEYGNPDAVYVTQDQIKELETIAEGTQGLEKICRAYGIQTIGTLLEANFKAAKNRLKAYVDNVKASHE